MGKYEMFSKRLKELRNSLGLTQKQLAQQVNTTSVTISAYESCTKNPPLNIVVAIAEQYHVSVDWMLGRENTVSNNEITSYKQVIEFFFKLKNKDGFNRLEIDTDNNAIKFNNKQINNFLSEWSKMIKENSVLCDEEMFKLWIEKTLNKYNVKIDNEDEIL